MCISKKLFLIQLSVIFVVSTAFTETTQAKSVYGVINNNSSKIAVYDIQGDQIEYQTQESFSDVDELIGLAIDPDSETLFATLHNTNEILLINAKTMEYLDNAGQR